VAPERSSSKAARLGAGQIAILWVAMDQLISAGRSGL